MHDAKVFFGGVPTDIEVKKLSDRFGHPEPGLIPYEELEAVLHPLTWSMGRFRLIVRNWRKQLRRELNVDTVMEPGKGVRVLLAHERIDVSHGDLRRAVRQAKRSYTRIMSVPVKELDTVARSKYDHVVRHTQAVFMASTNHERALFQELKCSDTLPRIAPSSLVSV